MSRGIPIARHKVPDETIGEVRAMVRSGMSIKRVAQQKQLARDTVRRYSEGDMPKSADAAVVDASETKTRQRVRENVETFLVKSTDIMATDEFVLEMSKRPKDLLIGVGIAIEKDELMSGRPTSREGRTVVIQFAGNEQAKSLHDLSLRSLSAQTEVIEGHVVEKNDNSK